MIGDIIISLARGRKDKVNGTGNWHFIKNMPSARYIESKVFSKDTLGNLHKIAASMVIPQKKNWYGKWIDDKYDASKHEEYAADMQEANFIHVYHSLVFFYQVYRNWIEVTRDYMKTEMTTAGMTTEQADSVLLLLCESTGGIIPPNLLPNTKMINYQMEFEFAYNAINNVI